MKILFCRIPAHFGVENQHPENSMIPMEIAYMSSIAKSAGVEVELLDLEAKIISYEEIKQIINSDFDYIVLRAKTPSFDLIKNLFKNTKASIIGIGHLFTTKPEAIFNVEDLNLICALSGETDYPFKTLLEKLLKNRDYKNVPNLIFKDNKEKIIRNQELILDDLDLLPSPDYNLFNVDDYYTFYPTPFGIKKKYGFIMSSRGCPYACSFCSPTLRNSFGKKMRYHSHERVINDLKTLKSLGRTIVFFRDDIFTINKKHTLELCNKIAKANIGIKWCVQTHVNNIDEELLVSMKESGCVSIGFGLESGSPKILKNIRKTNDITRAPKIVKFAKKIGIKTVCFFLVGCPDEDTEDHLLSLDLLKKTMPDLIQVAFFTPYPGSYDYERYIINKSGYDYSLHHYNNYKVNYTNKSISEIENFHQHLYKTWFFNLSTIFSITSSLLSDFLFNYTFFKNFLIKGLFFLKSLFQKKKKKEKGYLI